MGPRMWKLSMATCSQLSRRTFGLEGYLSEQLGPRQAGFEELTRARQCGQAAYGLRPFSTSANAPYLRPLGLSITIQSFVYYPAGTHADSGVLYRLPTVVRCWHLPVITIMNALSMFQRPKPYGI